MSPFDKLFSSNAGRVAVPQPGAPAFNRIADEPLGAFLLHFPERLGALPPELEPAEPVYLRGLDLLPLEGEDAVFENEAEVLWSTPFSPLAGEAPSENDLSAELSFSTGWTEKLASLDFDAYDA